jgi:hypothetical protein
MRSGVGARRRADVALEGGIRGETIDYRVRVADTEVRIQKTRHTPGPSM